VTDIREAVASNVGPSLVTPEDCRAVVLSCATNPRVLGRGCGRPAARQFPDLTAPQSVNRVFALRESGSVQEPLPSMSLIVRCLAPRKGYDDE